MIVSLLLSCQYSLSDGERMDHWYLAEEGSVVIPFESDLEVEGIKTDSAADFDSVRIGGNLAFTF